MPPPSSEVKKSGLFSMKMPFFNKRDNKASLLNEKKEEDERRKREEQ
jgi:hypothetical protein